MKQMCCLLLGKMGIMSEQQRPDINQIQSGNELRRWYWLKSELVDYCREHKIPYGGGKFELVDRIAYYLDTGEIKRQSSKKTTSKFNWAKETLTLETIITDSYKNNRNVREFMQQYLGQSFSFNMTFMNWMRDNTGKTLADAIEFWRGVEIQKSEGRFEQEIPDHNQYNQYMRDFFADNPKLTIKEARQCWDYKRQLPSDSGRHIYEPDDLASLKIQN